MGATGAKGTGPDWPGRAWDRRSFQPEFDGGAHGENRLAAPIHGPVLFVDRASSDDDWILGARPSSLEPSRRLSRGGRRPWKSGSDFSLPSAPDPTETSLDFSCVRGGTRASSKRVRPRVSTANRTVPIFHLERSCSSGRRALARGDRASRLAALGYQPKKDAPQTHESLAPKCLLDPVRFFECREAPKRTARPQFAFCTAFPKGVKRERSRRNWRPSPGRLRHRCNAHSVNR